MQGGDGRLTKHQLGGSREQCVNSRLRYDTRPPRIHAASSSINRSGGVISRKRTSGSISGRSATISVPGSNEASCAETPGSFPRNPIPRLITRRLTEKSASGCLAVCHEGKSITFPIPIPIPISVWLGLGRGVPVLRSARR